MKKIIFLIFLTIFICNFAFAQSKVDFFEAGVEFLMQEKYQEAIDNFTRFIEIDPNNAYVYKNRGVALMKLEQYDSAVIDFEKAKSISPNLSGIHSNLGVAWYCKKEYEKAIDNYSAEMKRTPEESFLFFNRALCYAELDKNEKALGDLARALEIKPDFHLALCFKGDLLMKLKRSGEARKSYEEAIVVTHAKEKIKQLNSVKTQTEETAKIRLETKPKSQPKIKKKKRLGQKRKQPEIKKSEPSESEKKKHSGTDQKPQKEPETPKIAVEKLKGKYSVQVGAFQNKNNAQRTKEKLVRNGYDSRVLILKGKNGKTWYMVRVGLFKNIKETKELILSLKEKMKIKDAFPRPVGKF